MNENNELAGATQPQVPTEVPPEPREIFPVVFEKDYMDFRPQSDAQIANADNEAIGPKSSSAPASVGQPQSVTGLEDLSADDLETTAPAPAEKDSSPATGTQTESGSATSSEVTSTGSAMPPAKT